MYHIEAKEFSFFVVKENDSPPFRVIQHHVKFAVPFFHPRFLVAESSEAHEALEKLLPHLTCDIGNLSLAISPRQRVPNA